MVVAVVGLALLASRPRRRPAIRRLVAERLSYINLLPAASTILRQQSALRRRTLLCQTQTLLQRSLALCNVHLPNSQKRHQLPIQAQYHSHLRHQFRLPLQIGLPLPAFSLQSPSKPALKTKQPLRRLFPSPSRRLLPTPLPSRLWYPRLLPMSSRRRFRARLPRCSRQQSRWQPPQQRCPSHRPRPLPSVAFSGSPCRPESSAPPRGRRWTHLTPHRPSCCRAAVGHFCEDLAPHQARPR
jgi:hypothetical protein